MIQTFIISSKNKKEGEKQMLKITSEHGVDNFDITFIEQTEKSIGVADVRNFQKKIFLKPFKSKVKAVIIKNSETLTTEAQNALLKILEEPPQNTIIILITTSKDLLLPTILSRGKIIELKETVRNLTKEEIDKNIQAIEQLLKAGVGERLKFAESIAKDKTQTEPILKNLIISLRESILKDENNFSYLGILKNLQKAYTILSTTNANPRLTIENFLLNI